VKPEGQGKFVPYGFQLHIFVSPFVEPAHVHIGSIVEFRFEGKSNTVLGTRIGYNMRTVESWFFSELQGRLGIVGNPMREDPDSECALDAGPREGQHVVPCQITTGPTDSDNSRRSREAPKKLSDARLLYPGVAMHGWKEASVVVKAVIARDGSVRRTRSIEIRVTDRHGRTSRLKGHDYESQFGYAAESAVSLWRYKPAYLQGCPVSTPMTVGVSFSFSRLR
jgi:hypothetical protein